MDSAVSFGCHGPLKAPSSPVSLVPILTDDAPTLVPVLGPHVALGAGVRGAVCRVLVLVAADIVAAEGDTRALPAVVHVFTSAALVARVLLAVAAQGLRGRLPVQEPQLFGWAAPVSFGVSIAEV